jgi:peptidoglycan/LPS O-acetylase OafA/YrhL
MVPEPGSDPSRERSFTVVRAGLQLSRIENAQRAPAYRPDIDGLRAIAVAAVVLFHTGIPGFSGGYVGVDVFFVISGYLITQLLVGSADKPLRSRLTDFYIRRGRRILPALFVTSLVTAVAAAAILLPWDLARFGNYLAATSVLLTNVVEWLDRLGYFQSTAAHSALAHFWSIAIEEQFYLIYPITLVIIGRYLPDHRMTALVALAGASFAVCVWGSYYALSANYLLAPSRAWELLLGAALATAGELGMKSRLANELLAVLGLIILAVAVYWYTPATRYPGLYTIAPCAASAALIVTGRQHLTVARKLLSLRPLVFTGLISYSLYLWHFPVLILSNYYYILKVGALGMGTLLALTYAVAFISWKVVERPIRARAFLKSNRSFLLTALVVNMVILVAGVTLWKSDGLPRRFPREVQMRDPAVSRDDVTPCVTLPFDKIASGELCSYGPQGPDAPRGLVWGDSHAMTLLPAYAKLAVSHHMRLYFAATSSCRPLLGLTNRATNESTRIKCARFNAAVVQAVRRLDPRLLILNAHWIDADADLIPQSNASVTPAASKFTRGLQETLRQTGSNRRSVCIVLDVPMYDYDLPYALGIARKRGIAEDFMKVSRAQALEEYRAPERDIRALEQRGMLRAVDPKDLLCRADSCAFEADGNLLYRDGDHLSSAGAQFVSSVIDGCFRDIAPIESR